MRRKKQENCVKLYIREILSWCWGSVCFHNSYYTADDALNNLPTAQQFISSTFVIFISHLPLLFSLTHLCPIRYLLNWIFLVFILEFPLHHIAALLCHSTFYFCDIKFFFNFAFRQSFEMCGNACWTFELKARLSYAMIALFWHEVGRNIYFLSRSHEIYVFFFLLASHNVIADWTKAKVEMNMEQVKIIHERVSQKLRFCSI